MTTGTEVVRIAETRTGERYVLGTLVPKDDGGWRGPWDCAEFVSWCVYQASGQLYGCENNAAPPAKANAYTGYWSRDAQAIGKKISLEEAARTPGALLLRVPQPGLTGHIVILDGKGGTVEAHSSAMGVIKGTLANRRWDTGILVPWIDYAGGDSHPVTPPAIVYRVTEPLMKGAKIEEIQVKLQALGYDVGEIDGIFGPQTAASVHSFQLSQGLVPDGEVGPLTAAALGIKL